MFKAKIDDAKFLKDILTAVSTIVGEATFNITSSGMQLRAMDASRVALVDLTLPEKTFTEFKCDKQMSLGIDINNLLKLIKKATKENIITLSLDDTDARMAVSIKGKYSRRFEVPVLTSEATEVPEIKVAYHTSAKMMVDGLKDVVDDASLVAEHMKFEAEGIDKVYINATGDLMKVKIRLTKGDDVLIEMDSKEDSKGQYSILFLNEILKASSATAQMVDVDWSTDMPLRLSFNVEREAKIIFNLAPRVDPE